MRTKRLIALAVACAVLGTGAIAPPAWAESNAVMAWGQNIFGELGNGSELTSPVPGEVHGLGEVSAISGGATHSLALRPPKGIVMAWGLNKSGQLGTETTVPCTCSMVPVEVPAFTEKGEVTAIATGAEHSLALKGGKVWSWGLNTYGQLGRNPAETSSKTPAPVEGLGTEEATAISASNFASYALMQNHTVLAWGRNEHGDLGNGGSELFNPKPTPVVRENGEPLTEVAAIAGSSAGAIALLKNGTVVTWGDNHYGELGIGTFEGPEVCPPRKFTCSRRALVVPGLQEATAISAHVGGATGVALLKNHTVMDWGFNYWGQLGDGKSGIDNGGEAANSSIPVHVKGLGSNVVSIASEAYANMALLPNGHVMAWGDDERGELGDGRQGLSPPVYSELPVEVLLGLSEVTAIAGGGHFGMAIQKRP